MRRALYIRHFFREICDIAIKYITLPLKIRVRNTQTRLLSPRAQQPHRTGGRAAQGMHAQQHAAAKQAYHCLPNADCQHRQLLGKATNLQVDRRSGDAHRERVAQACNIREVCKPTAQE